MGFVGFTSLFESSQGTIQLLFGVSHLFLGLDEQYFLFMSVSVSRMSCSTLVNSRLILQDSFFFILQDIVGSHLL
jgi:hypothetical protein